MKLQITTRDLENAENYVEYRRRNLEIYECVVRSNYKIVTNGLKFAGCFDFILNAVAIYCE